MEAKANEPAYTALKRLDKEGILRFELSYVTAPYHVHAARILIKMCCRSVVQDLIKASRDLQADTFHSLILK